MVCTLLTPHRVWAQVASDCHYTVRGEIREMESGIPVLGATVYIRELGRGAVADPDGKYTIANLCAGDYTMICQHLGYHADTILIHVHEGFIQCNFTLDEADIQLNAVVVAGERALPLASQPVAELTGQELQNTRGLTLGESLRELTGVNSIQTGPAISKPVIHGLHGNRILILNNGIRQEGQQWGAEHAPEIDPFVARRITVVKGAAGVRYGADAIGGVILVEPAPLPVHAGTRGELNLIGYSNGWGGVTSGQVEGGSRRLEGLGWRLQGTLKRAGDARAADYLLSNTGVSEANFSGGLGYRKNKYGLEAFVSHFRTNTGILRSAHIGNLSDLERALQSPRPWYIRDFTYQIENPRQAINHSLLKISGFAVAPAVGTFTLQYGSQINNRQEFDIRRGGRSNRPALDLQLFTHTLDAVLEHNPVRRFSGSAGVNLLYQDNNNLPGTGVTPLIPNYNSFAAGVFATEKWSAKKWTLEGGVRYDYRYLQAQRFNAENQLVKPDFHFRNVLATAGAVFYASEQWNFKTNLGTAWRPPNVSELYSQGLHHGLGAIEEGNESLQTERALKWINTVSYTGTRLSFEGSLHYNRIDDYIYLEPDAEPRLTIRGAFPVFRYTQTDARLMGTDAALAYQMGSGLTFRSKASLIRARDLVRNNFLIFIPADRFENSLTYRKDKLGKLSDAFLTIGAVNVRHQNRTPEGVDYANAPDSYMLLNLQGGITFPTAGRPLTIGLTVSNALNTAYRDYLNRLRYYADDVGRNVMLRLKYEFGKIQ
jgi:iron complex outermembrane receptor protein